MKRCCNPTRAVEKDNQGPDAPVHDISARCMRVPTWRTSLILRTLIAFDTREAITQMTVASFEALFSGEDTLVRCPIGRELFGGSMDSSDDSRVAVSFGFGVRNYILVITTNSNTSTPEHLFLPEEARTQCSSNGQYDCYLPSPIVPSVRLWHRSARRCDVGPRGRTAFMPMLPLARASRR